MRKFIDFCAKSVTYTHANNPLINIDFTLKSFLVDGGFTITICSRSSFWYLSLRWIWDDLNMIWTEVSQKLIQNSWYIPKYLYCIMTDPALAEYLWHLNFLKLASSRVCDVLVGYRFVNIRYNMLYSHHHYTQCYTRYATLFDI